MVADQSEEFGSRLAHALDEDGSETEEGRWLRGYARAAFAGDEGTQAASAGLLAAIANNPDLLEPLRRNFKRWQKLAEGDGVDPALGTVIRLAVEGLWFADLFGFAAPSGAKRAKVLDVILGLAGDSK